MAKQPSKAQLKLEKQNPVTKVHYTKGCNLCSRTDEHTHSAREWNKQFEN